MNIPELITAILCGIIGGILAELTMKCLRSKKNK